MVVTIDASSKNAYYSSGDIGWSARSVFPYSIHLSQLVSGTVASWGNVDSSARQAQSFTPTANISTPAISAVLVKLGSPTDNLTLKITTDNSNKPSTTVLATSNVVAASSLDGTSTAWIRFTFPTSIALTSGTKYWYTIERSGALDAVNYFNVRVASSSVYASHGRSSYTASTTTWGAESANDMPFIIHVDRPTALYSVTQDTSLHVWKSTDDGATWSEQDSADAPTVTNANYPFDATDTNTGPYIVTARMTGANAAAVRVFDMSTDQWNAADYGTTPPTTVSNERSIRITNDNIHTSTVPGSLYMVYTDSADDADIGYQRVTGSGNAWGAKVSVAAVTSAEASLVSDVVLDKYGIGFQHRFYYECTADDFINRSITMVSGSPSTGTATVVDATAATTDTKYAPATYQSYLDASGVTTIIAAYINSDDTIRERILSLDVTSASVTMAAEAQISAATTTAGRTLSTCRYDTTNYAVVSVSGTGISYHTSTVAGTWSSAVAWKTGLTTASVSRALAIPDVGVLVVYTDNGDSKIDWIVYDGRAAVAQASLTLTGQTVTATGPGGGVDGTALVTQSALTLTGQTLTGAAGTTAAVTQAAMTLSGQAVSATGQRNETATVTQASLSFSGQSVVGSASVVAAISAAALSLIGQAVTVTGQRNETTETSAASIALIGQPVTVTATVAVTAEITNADLALVGQSVSVTGQRNETAETLPVTITLTGQSVSATGQRNEFAETTNALLTLTEQSLTAHAGTSALLDSATITLIGQSVTATGQRNETATIDSAQLTLIGNGATASATAGEEALISTVSLNLAGQSVTVTGQRNEIAEIGAASVDLLGQPVSVSASIAVMLSSTDLTLSGQSVTAIGQRNEIVSITSASLQIVGQSVIVDALADGEVSVASATLTLVGQVVTVAGQRNATVVPTAAILEFTGQPVTVTGQRNETALISQALLSLDAQPIFVTGETNIYPVAATFTFTGLTVTATGEMVVTDATMTASVTITPYFSSTVSMEAELSAELMVEEDLTGETEITSELTASASIEALLVASVEITP